MHYTSPNVMEPTEFDTQPRLRFTIFGGLLIICVYLLLQFATTFFSIFILGFDPLERMGDLVALGINASAIPCTGLIVLILIRTRSIEPRSWLALFPVRTTHLIGWLVFTFVLLQLADFITIKLGRSPIPPIMETMIETTSYTVLLWFALVIAAPVFEECLFRGFLFEGLRRTKIGVGGTIVVTTLLWTLLHAAQYDQYFLTLIALIGILLGIAREYSRSLYVPIAIHAVNNLLGTLQMSEKEAMIITVLF